MIYQFTMVQSQPQQGAFPLSAQARNNTNRNKNSMAAAQITTGRTPILLLRGKTPRRGGQNPCKIPTRRPAHSFTQISAIFKGGIDPAGGFPLPAPEQERCRHFAPQKRGGDKKVYRRGGGALFRKSPLFADYPRRGRSKRPAKNQRKKSRHPPAGMPAQKAATLKRRSATAFAVYHDAGADARAMEDCKT